MRSRFRNRTRDRGSEPIRLLLAVGVTPVPAEGPEYFLPKRSAYGIAMEKDYLTLKRATASRPSADDYDVLTGGEVVGRIFKADLSMDVDIGHRVSRTPQPTQGYAATRESAMAAFAKSWRGNKSVGASRARGDHSCCARNSARPPY